MRSRQNCKHLMKLSECSILKRVGNSHKHHSFPKKELDGD